MKRNLLRIRTTENDNKSLKIVIEGVNTIKDHNSVNIFLSNIEWILKCIIRFYWIQ